MGRGWSILGDEELVQPRWEEPPYKRGSFQILTECIITLLLCAWTAIHLNIPRLRSSRPESRNKFRRWMRKIAINWRKIGYLILAMVAPELIATVAYFQWKKKRALWKIVQEQRLHIEDPAEKAASTSDEEPPRCPDEEAGATNAPTSVGATPGSEAGAGPSPCEGPSLKTSPRQNQLVWTETHCWYAMIGGFVIQDYNGKPFPLPNGLKRMTLQHRGLEYFVRNHPQVFPHLSARAILDKSKANSMAKTLVCLQALYFCVNLLGRVVNGLPLTVLELNTAAHCICTLITYGFWWDKPYDISEPSSIVLDRVTAVKAAMVCLLSWEGSQVKCTVSKSGDPRDSSFGMSRYVQLTGQERAWSISDLLAVDPEDWTLTPTTLPQWKKLTATGLDMFDPLTGRLSFFYCHGRNLFPGGGGGKVKTFAIGRHLAFLEPSFAAYPLSASTEDGPFLVASHPKELHALFQLIDQCTIEDCQLPLPDCRGHQLAEEASLDIHWGQAADGDSEFLILLAACALYAAIHALAWNGPFHTKAEASVWRMSVLAFIPAFGLFALLFVLMFIDGRKEQMIAGAGEGRKGRVWLHDKLANLIDWISWVALAATIPCVGAFLVGRVFLMVESFLALPYAPRGAFEVPRWSAYVPHFS